MRLVQFLMAIQDEFEHTRASLLHRSLLPSLESALSELISEKTRFSTMKLHNTSEMVMATTSRNTHAPSSIPTGSSPSHHVQCTYCHQFGHKINKCRTRLYRNNHRTPRHKVAVVAHTDASNMSLISIAPSSSTLSSTEIEALIH
jgi:hypothetical protein